MRADRLLTMLMLLQTRGRLTARQLAAELEVSERTVYRDLMALSTSGVPVYAERGPRGGCGLLESYRTTLTGLTPEETRALFMLNIPEVLDQLGVGQELKTALLKLSAALPDSRRQEESLARQRIYLDPRDWSRAAANPGNPACLPVIQQAVWQDHWLRLRYRSFFGAEIEQVVAPYGLVAKANAWYVAYTYQDNLRVQPIGRVMAATLLPQTFTRPADFDLAGFWAQWCASVEENRPVFQARVSVSPALAAQLPPELRAQAGAPARDGWIPLELEFESFHAARSQILSWGSAAEVLAPEPLRRSVIDFAAQIVGFYNAREKG